MVTHVASPADGINVSASRLPGRIHVGHLALHQLEFADCPAELLALMQEGHDGIHARRHDAEWPTTQDSAFVIEAGHQHRGAFANAAQNVFFRYFAVVEKQRKSVGAAHAELVEVAAVAETRHAFFDDKGGHALGPGIKVGLGIDDQGVGIATIGNPHLGTVQDVTVAFFLGFQLHRHHVGTGIRLGHRQGADVFTGNQFGQIFLALGFGTVAANLVYAQIRVCTVGQADRGRSAGDFLQSDDVGKIAHAGPAVFLASGHAEQTHLAKFPPQISREFVGAVNFGRPRRDFDVGKGFDRIAQQIDVFAEGEVEAGNVHGSSPV